MAGKIIKRYAAIMKIKVLLLLFSAAAFLPACAPTTTEPQALNVELAQTQIAQQLAQSATYTPQPVQVNTSTTAQSEGAGRAGLPGLSSTLVAAQVQGYGFNCAQPELNNTNTAQRCDLTTDEYQLTVTIWGRTAESVDMIEAAAFYYGDAYDYTDLTAVIFGNIAALPYEASVPEQASAWVQQTIPAVQNTGDEAINHFGGVRYYIYALPSIQVLEIGELHK
jgi:hypothetical protein